jgi:hypothetical protein
MIVVIFLNPLQLSENLFSHMSQEEQRELALQYSSGDSHVKVMQYYLFFFIDFLFFKINNSLVSNKHFFCFDQEKYDDMYGEVFMAYFAAGALNISSFDMSTFVPKMLSDKSGKNWLSGQRLDFQQAKHA